MCADGLGRDLDIDYALGELQNVQSELELYFGKQGLVLARLERLEWAVKKLTQAARPATAEVIEDGFAQSLCEFNAPDGKACRA